ncbi:hypothetical protein NESM_000894500 [Novymonas esmeraldas]|uniref:Uncharacterized protein n=1 Tax=Novymonas esmeraldas TaxID=1808958 RepID=A0AAW0EXZ0_9TRYP
MEHVGCCWTSAVPCNVEDNATASHCTPPARRPPGRSAVQRQKKTFSASIAAARESSRGDGHQAQRRASDVPTPSSALQPPYPVDTRPPSAPRDGEAHSPHERLPTSLVATPLPTRAFHNLATSSLGDDSPKMPPPPSHAPEVITELPLEQQLALLAAPAMTPSGHFLTHLLAPQTAPIQMQRMPRHRSLKVSTTRLTAGMREGLWARRTWKRMATHTTVLSGGVGGSEG